MKCHCMSLIYISICIALAFMAGCQESQVSPKQAGISEKASSAKVLPEPGTAKPKIEFENTVHDFGKIGVGSVHDCQFKFKNVGNAELKIDKIQTTCGCTVAKPDKPVYAPGESGTIIITYTADSRPMLQSKDTYIYTNDNDNTKVKLTIKADIIRKIDYEPKSIELFQKKGDANCPQITLKSTDNRPFLIRIFKSTGDCIVADFDPLKTDTEFVLKPTVDPNKLRRGLRGRIDITLSHPDCKSVTIPFNITPEFTVNPSLLYILNAKPAEPVTRELWLLNNYGEKFQIQSVSSQKGLIEVVCQEETTDGYKFELRITPPADKAETAFFTDMLIIQIKDGPKMEVSCNGFYSRN